MDSNALAQPLSAPALSLRLEVRRVLPYFTETPVKSIGCTAIAAPMNDPGSGDFGQEAA